MDKKVIFAVAGAGKTATIIDSLSLESRSLIITYTENNFINLKQRVIRKFGYLPDNIKIYTYFSFLFSFCFKPFLSDIVEAKGIFWDTPPITTLRMKRNNPLFYMTQGSRLLYHNRLAKLLEQMNLLDDINKRLEKYFDNLYIDEIQDFGGHDFNFLKSIANAEINMTFVGDFFQHTFDTSKDGNTNKNIHNDYENYKTFFEEMGLTIDTESLSKSYRCSSNICDFVTTSLGIDLKSHRGDETKIIHVEDKEEANCIYTDDSIIKLFYQNSTKYNCSSVNWGKSKGLDHYQDICVVLNSTSYKKFINGELLELSPQTKNKLYVACTRARGNLYLLNEKMYQNYKK